VPRRPASVVGIPLTKETHVRTSLSIAAAGLLVLAWSGTARTGETDEARALVTKAIKAMGGETALAKHKAATWKETGTYYGMGDGLPFAGRYAMEFPDKFRMEIEGVFTIVYAGDKGWTIAGGETKEMTKEQLAAQRTDHRAGWVASLLPLKDKAFTLTTIPDAKVDGRAAAGIKVTRKGYPDVKLYLDKETYLPAKLEWTTMASEDNFKEMTAEMYYSKYKEIDGAQIPTRLILKRDGKLYVEADVQDMKAVGKLDPKVFAMP
jgi:hypothetical protein